MEEKAKEISEAKIKKSQSIWTLRAYTKGRYEVKNKQIIKKKDNPSGLIQKVFGELLHQQYAGEITDRYCTFLVALATGQCMF